MKLFKTSAIVDESAIEKSLIPLLQYLDSNLSIMNQFLERPLLDQFLRKAFLNTSNSAVGSTIPEDGEAQSNDVDSPSLVSLVLWNELVTRMKCSIESIGVIVGNRVLGSGNLGEADKRKVVALALVLEYLKAFFYCDLDGRCCGFSLAVLEDKEYKIVREIVRKMKMCFGNLIEMESSPRLFGIPLKYLSLLTLVVQNSMLVIIMKFSRNRLPGEDMYLKSTAVLASEFVKLCICVAVYTKEQNGFDPLKMLNDLFGSESEAWKMFIPAVVYVIQNNLQYLAVENLDPATFQVSYQLKILTTALFSVLMLKKSLSKLKWFSLIILTFGVALVQLQTDSSGGQKEGHHTAAENFVGLVAVAIACVLSGIAGVWFEKVLKGSKTSLWQKNIQLSFFSLFPAIITVFTIDGSAVLAGGFFHGYNGWTFGAIACQALGGLLVSLVVKYADNILKGFATSLSIILSAFASVFLFGFEISAVFVVGCGFVLYATHLYGLPDPPAAADYAKLRAEDAKPVPKALRHSAKVCLSVNSSHSELHVGLACKYYKRRVIDLSYPLVLVMKYSRTLYSRKEDMYLASTAVLMSEILKLGLCIWLYLQESQNKGLNLQKVFNNLFGPEAESWKMMIPAGLYVIQNNLQYLAVSNLDPATFQVTYQMKILTTAVFSVMMLKRSLSPTKWFALVLLTVGIALVQIPTDGASTSSSKSAAESFIGLLAVAVACILSGLAGVWFEKVLKGSSASVWHRNIQLSTFSLVPGLIGVVFINGSTIASKGFFHGYNFWTWGAIANQAFGGLIVALVVKYADNILKGFATSISIILSAIASVFLFDFYISYLFVIGAAVVLYATHLYGLPDAPAPPPLPYTKIQNEESK
ncbi:UNVERIFIED_CONTAM: hypothetical protein HDU68_004087 [Siphonaria sp. JEL0065]|nr:hypothetical protein HDU68_004087 [Siphonaria sp. JEL0065]